MYKIKLQGIKFLNFIKTNIIQMYANMKYNSGSIILKEDKQMGAVVIGDINSAVDKQILKPLKIITIFTFGSDASPQKQQNSIAYKQYNISDNKSQNILDLFDEVCVEMEAGRKKGGILLHCYTGVSRSVSFVIAYLMNKKKMAYENAKNYVKKHRNIAHPNDNFQRQLQKYEKILHERILKKLLQEKEKMQNESALLSNMSSVSKRSHVRGAVRSAHKSISPSQHKTYSIEKPLPNKFEFVTIPERDEKHLNRSKQKQKWRKEIKSIYGNKIKIK